MPSVRVQPHSVLGEWGLLKGDIPDPLAKMSVLAMEEIRKRFADLGDLELASIVQRAIAEIRTYGVLRNCRQCIRSFRASMYGRTQLYCNDRCRAKWSKLGWKKRRARK